MLSVTQTAVKPLDRGHQALRSWLLILNQFHAMAHENISGSLLLACHSSFQSLTWGINVSNNPLIPHFPVKINTEATSPQHKLKLQFGKHQMTQRSGFAGPLIRRTRVARHHASRIYLINDTGQAFITSSLNIIKAWTWSISHKWTLKMWLDRSSC